MAERLDVAIATVAYTGGFSHMVKNQHITPPPPSLEVIPLPFHHLGSGRRPEKVHCTELLKIQFNYRKLTNQRWPT
jgi:hypothetical protein